MERRPRKTKKPRKPKKPRKTRRPRKLTPQKKRKKPKNNIVKSNSSFVSRIITHEHLTKRLSDRSPEGLLVFANVNRAFNFLDMGSQTKVPTYHGCGLLWENQITNSLTNK